MKYSGLVTQLHGNSHGYFPRVVKNN